MSRISEKAGVSHRYTNHSLRATLVHTLDSTGLFAGRHIMSITGHRAESSLKIYSGQTEPEIKRMMSDTISKTLRAETCVKEVKEEDQSAEYSNTTCFDVSEVELKVLSNSQYDHVLTDLLDDDFNSVLSSLDFDYEMSKVDNSVQNVSISNLQGKK